MREPILKDVFGLSFQRRRLMLAVVISLTLMPCLIGGAALQSSASYASTIPTTPKIVALSPNNCSEKASSFDLNRHQTVRVGAFEATAAEGLMLFINGPEKKYNSSKPLISDFCRHGFTVFAFNVVDASSYGKSEFKAKTQTKRRSQSVSEAAYLRAASVLLAKIRKVFPNQKMIVYGWSKGASVAARLVRENHSSFERLILESPHLSMPEAQLIANIPRHMTRIFACPRDQNVQLRNIRYTKRAFVYVPAHAKCGHSLSANPEARDPMVDFIESDFAGIQAQNWYWTRRL